MLPEIDVHRDEGRLQPRYYNNEDAQASSVSVPLVYRDSSLGTYCPQRDSLALSQNSDRHSELFTDLLEEVRKPTMPQRKNATGSDDLLPPSLRIAGAAKAAAGSTKAAKSVPKQVKESAPLAKAKVLPTKAVPQIESKKGAQSTSKEAVGKQDLKKSDKKQKPEPPSKQQSKKAVAAPAGPPTNPPANTKLQSGSKKSSGSKLPTSTYQPPPPPSLPAPEAEGAKDRTLDEPKYKPYRPQESTQQPSAAKDGKAKKGSKKLFGAATAAADRFTGGKAPSANAVPGPDLPRADSPTNFDEADAYPGDDDAFQDSEAIADRTPYPPSPPPVNAYSQVKSSRGPPPARTPAAYPSSRGAPTALAAAYQSNRGAPTAQPPTRQLAPPPPDMPEEPQESSVSPHQSFVSDGDVDASALSPPPQSPMGSDGGVDSFDNSTPGSPHDTPLQFAQSPLGATADDDNLEHGDLSFDDNAEYGNDDYDENAENAEPELPETSNPPEALSPSSSFGGSEMMPEDGEAFQDIGEDYPPQDGEAYPPGGDEEYVLEGQDYPPPNEEGYPPEDGDNYPLDGGEVSRDIGEYDLGEDAEPVNFDPTIIQDGVPELPEEDFDPPEHSVDLGSRDIEGSDAEYDMANEKGMIEEPEPKKPLWKQPKIMIIAGVVLVLVIILIGVGIFFGTKKKAAGDSANANQAAVPGGFRTQNPALVNDASAMTGTAMNAVTFGGPGRRRQSSSTTGSSSTNFLNFYQHSNGEIRMARFQNAQFQPSTLVATDAHIGTPIAAYLKPDNLQISVFYFDNGKILQEMRSVAGADWQPGTIGTLMQSSNAPSDLAVEYVGACKGAGLAWLTFHTGVNDQTTLLYWNEATDTWTESGGFPGVKQGAGFTGQSDLDAWRFYFVSSQTSQLSEMVCPSCCASPEAPAWVPGINGPPVTSATGGITVVNAGEPRMLYYQDADGTVRELNNTGKFPNEVYITNAASGRRGNTGLPAPQNATIGPVGAAIGKVVPESKMGVGAGFRGRVAQIWLFAQLNGSDISVTTRNVDTVGQWSPPQPVPVGR